MCFPRTIDRAVNSPGRLMSEGITLREAHTADVGIWGTTSSTTSYQACNPSYSLTDAEPYTTHIQRLFIEPLETTARLLQIAAYTRVSTQMF